MDMRDWYLRRSFFQHRGLIAFAVGGAIAETVLLLILAPAAVSLGPQLTAMPSIAAYHDLRWLFAGQESALLFALGALVLLAARAALDAVLLRLAWPRMPGGSAQPPSMVTAFCSCLGLTALTWLLLAPAVTLTFGVAVVPFSWPFLAALPLVVGIAAALSHGGVTSAWWRRLPPPATVGWLLISFVALSLASIAMLRSAAVLAVLIAAVAGLVNARAWYAIAATAARLPQEVTSHDSAWRTFGKLVGWIPLAPIAALLVVVLAVGVARLLFTGTIQLPVSRPVSAAALAGDGNQVHAKPSAPREKGSVLVVGGFGSSCCDDTGDLGASGMNVRQFSYAGLTAKGEPRPQGSSADDVPLPWFGDQMAVQVLRMHKVTGRPVNIVAESEGTLGLYAMLARHPGLPIGKVVLLSPIIAPGQYGTDSSDAISQDALNELNTLIGRMSPYGSEGAEELINSVARYGAAYFADVTADRGRGVQALVVVPLADATTMACDLPSSVLVVPEFHGGLLGDPAVQLTVRSFLSGHGVPAAMASESDGFRTLANAISDAASAWRMPVARLACS
jgi:hypothetical protein